MLQIVKLKILHAKKDGLVILNQLRKPTKTHEKPTKTCWRYDRVSSLNTKSVWKYSLCWRLRGGLGLAILVQGYAGS